MTTSVVICAYSDERWDDLVAAVRSVAGQSPAPHQVIVVIDHNDDLRARAAERLGCTVVANAGPRGLSGGRNTGLATATGDIVAFLDDDAVAAPGWLASLTSHFADPAVAGVGGRVLPSWDEPPPAWLPEEFWWVIGCSYRGLPTEVARVRNPIGANMAFRREVLDDVGGFDTDFGRVGTSTGHNEETELGVRVAARRPGAVILYEPAAVVDHRVPAARLSWDYFRHRCYTEGLAKAQLSRLRGAREGLSAERSYVTHALPWAVGTGVAESLRTRTAPGLTRSAAVAAGLALTTAGYVVGRVTALSGRGRSPR